MTKNKNTHSEDQFESVENVLSRTEQFIEENQKTITTVVLIILAAVAVFMGVRRFYIKPLEAEAQTQMFMAEQYFAQDSFKLAMYGDGNYFGFIDIIDEYGITKSGNLAKYYAGISSLHLGEFDEAVGYLKKFKKRDKIVGAIAYGGIGDAYMELGEIEKAVSYYIKAADYNPNKFVTPTYLMKAGYAYESMEEYNSALKVYTRIKKDFKDSQEASTIDKFIERAKIKVQ